MAKMYGIDVFSGEGKNITKEVAYDFAIVKVSGNPQEYAWNYVNPYAKTQADAAYKKTGLVGLYHFTFGLHDPYQEVKLFCDNVKEMGYIGKAILIIDYEAQAVKKGRGWVAKFAKGIMDRTGCVPMIYASGSVIVEQNLGALGYPIWEASYPLGNQKIYGYEPPKGKVWYKDRVMWQYTGTGRLKGHSGNLDLNVFYGGKEKWMELVKADEKKKKKTPEYPTVNLKKGDKGGQVKRLQKCLNKLIKAGLEVDGSFGPATFKAVKKFQKKHDLAVDGSCGPKTRAKIKKELNKK